LNLAQKPQLRLHFVCAQHGHLCLTKVRN